MQEKQSKILELERQVPGHYDHAVADYKASQEFKDLLQAARDGASTKKFNEWSEHGYIDRPRMVADLLAVKAQAQKDAQPILMKGPPETQTETAREKDDNDSGSEGDEEVVDLVERDQA